MRGVATMPDLSASCLAVLGLVAIRPTSGYELVAFADRSIAYFWSIPRSQLYRELARLEELGLISGTHVTQTSAPDKRVFEISEAGRDVLVAWVESPTLPATRSKNGFLLKVFMARHARPEALGPLLRGYRETVELELRDLRAIVDQLADHPRATFGRLTARWGVVHAEASLAWLDEAEALVASGSDSDTEGLGPEARAESTP
jgi:PadR family transcriptional regulator, regulatory protein AphA